MKEPNFRKHTKEEEEEIQREFDKPIDWSKAMRKGIFINLDPEIIEYFKNLSKENGKGYQTLIQEALHYFKDKKLKPRTIWEAEKTK
ncbi:MAG TPA: BrnA antitoxin family protein [Bacteriovoracaceae bacterium]|nr:BrnA antitoxin family protein [Bacteriovoracaceae bacterium]